MMLNLWVGRSMMEDHHRQGGGDRMFLSLSAVVVYVDACGSGLVEFEKLLSV